MYMYTYDIVTVPSGSSQLGPQTSFTLTKSNVLFLGGKLPYDDVPRLHIEVYDVFMLGAYLDLHNGVPVHGHLSLDPL